MIFQSYLSFKKEETNDSSGKHTTVPDTVQCQTQYSAAHGAGCVVHLRIC